MASRIRVYVKRELRLDRLDFDQRQMFKLGNVALASRKNEIDQAKNASGGSAKPLKKRYAIYKSKIGKGNRRNLNKSGRLMRNWSVRTVSANIAVASWTTRRDRDVAWANEKVEVFVSHSPQNEKDVTRAGRIILVQEKIPNMVLQKERNG